MPADVAPNGAYTGPKVTFDDFKALENWIDSLSASSSAQSCVDRKFISDEDIVDAILQDLQKQIPARLKGMRYITLTNLYNACTPDNHMNVYRNGVVKLLNSLGRTSVLVTANSI